MVLLWLVNLTCSGHSCPKDLLSEVFSCLRNLTHGSNQSTLMSAIDAELMKQNCRSGAFDDSVQCLERLYDRCDSPEAKEWLQKLARPRRWEAGFRRFCRHVDLYIAQKHCIQQQNAELEACVNRHKDKFTNTNTYVSYTPTGYSVNEQVLKSTCSVFHWTDHCLNFPLGQSCGEPVGAVVKDFQGGITPPVCANYQVNESSSRTSYTSNIVVILLCTFMSLVLLRCP